MDLLKFSLSSVPANPGRPDAFQEFIKLVSQTSIPVSTFSRKAAKEAIKRSRQSFEWETF